jgi:hypothetical protein
MINRSRFRWAGRLSSIVAVVASILTVHGDEGMWLFTDPPRKLLRERHGFEVTDAWLERLQKASVRFMSGGSGSFVSEDGLVMSNHHVGADAIQKLSTEERDLLEEGFYAATLEEELPCKDLELNVLVSIEDVTARVNAAVPANLPPEEAAVARRAVLAEIEQESLNKTGLRSDVVTLYQGGTFHLYRYKRYTDVRLVFAPEQQAAYFGGDPDNFEFPRYCLDVAFFRAYENGRPAKVEHYLRWSPKGARDGDLVFVSGHPGRTSRLLTVAELEYVRDRALPAMLERLNRLEVVLSAWSARSPENARRAKDDLFGVQNSRKARFGGLAGLQDPGFFKRIVEKEAELRKKMGQSAEWEKALSAFDRIAAAQERIGGEATRHRFLESAWAFRSQLFDFARTLLRAGDERALPSGKRLREFRDSNRESLELDLFSTRPIYDDLETLSLGDSLGYMVEKFGVDDPLVRRILDGKSPRVRAAELVAGTKLKDVETRRKLYDGGAEAVKAAKDPMIELARLVDPEARATRKVVEEQEEIKRQAHSELAKARFALGGADTYPDATFTLRLAYGVVKGFEDAGQFIPPFTQIEGLYERAESREGRYPYQVADLWMKRRDAVDLKTPFNFVHTADIIGGNSGSPTVDRAGELVGLIFDGNPASLVLDYAYEDQYARAISVDTRAIMEALKSVYRADALVAELERGR